MRVPKIYDYFKEGEIFTIQDARNKLNCSAATLRKNMSLLIAKGYIVSIRQGLYFLDSQNKPLPSKTLSPFAVAARLSQDCYLMFGAALYFLAHDYFKVLPAVYVGGPRKFNDFVFDNVRYIWCSTGWIGHEGVLDCSFLYNEITTSVRTTCAERTLIDCLRRPQCAPSLDTLLDLVKDFDPPPDLDKILYYAGFFGSGALFNRLGFVVEHLQQEWDVSEKILGEIRTKMSKRLVEWSALTAFQQRSSVLINDYSLTGDALSVFRGSEFLNHNLRLQNRWRLCPAFETQAFKNSRREA